MKKQLIALAVAGAMTAPMIAQADATLYGSLRLGVVKEDGNGSTADGDIRVDDTSSRIGIKGTVDLGLENTEGLFKAEWQAYGADATDQSTALGSRLLMIGMRGDWGTAIIGKQYLPHYLWIQAPTNVFNPGSTGFGERFNLGNGAAGKSGHFLKRTEGSLTYHSPKMNGFQFVGGVVLLGNDDDTDGTTDSDVDAYNVAVRYAANGLAAAISYGDIEVADSPLAKNETDVLGVAVSYKVNAFEVMAKYEEEENEVSGATVTDEEVIELAVRYTAGMTSVYGRVSEYDEDVNDLDYTQWGIGVQQKLGKGRVYLEHVNNDSDDTSNGDRTVAGYRLDF